VIQALARGVTLVAALAGCAVAGVASAQTLAPPQELPPSAAPGWTVTPSIGVAALWDDNLAVVSEGQQPLNDQVTSVTPSFVSRYRGRRGDVLLEYRGAFDFYRRYTDFDSADHRGRIDGKRRLSRSVTAFARDYFAHSPTTEVPINDTGLLTLRRRTTQFNDFRGGLDIVPARHTTLTLAYGSQWMDLAADEQVQPLLRGGYANSADVTLKRELSSRMAVGAEYDYQHSVVSDGDEVFDIQHAQALFDFDFTPGLTLSSGVGYAWQLAGRDQPADSAPAVRADLRYQARRTLWSLGYSRSFLPSFGFGGTVQNEEVRGSVQVPVTRAVELNAVVSARQNDPLAATGGAALRAVSAQGSALWTVAQWLRLELFAVYSGQDAQRAGGRINRTRAGVRLITLHPMRLQ
jgi:hypothetical protein